MTNDKPRLLRTTVCEKGQNNNQLPCCLHAYNDSVIICVKRKSLETYRGTLVPDAKLHKTIFFAKFFILL